MEQLGIKALNEQVWLKIKYTGSANNFCYSQ